LSIDNFFARLRPEAPKTGVPLGRAGQAQDIANGLLFLASDASSYMTGAELVIERHDGWRDLD
jgi:NAD(P)-dependent dehydrogenase (short-subunit alcohol dehydrogenase family)